jgi:hypothetical protein
METKTFKSFLESEKTELSQEENEDLEDENNESTDFYYESLKDNILNHKY